MFVLVERFRMAKGVYEGIVKNLIVTDEGLFITTRFWHGGEIPTPESNVFLTKEEAEAALKGGAQE